MNMNQFYPKMSPIEEGEVGGGGNEVIYVTQTEWDNLTAGLPGEPQAYNYNSDGVIESIETTNGVIFIQSHPGWIRQWMADVFGFGSGRARPMGRYTGGGIRG